MVLYMYIAPGKGQTAQGDKDLINVLSLHSRVASFKKCIRSLILYNFFHDLIHINSPGTGTDSPQGTKF